MFRKLLVVAAAIAMPVSMVTLTGLAGTGGIAGAKAPPPLARPGRVVPHHIDGQLRSSGTVAQRRCDDGEDVHHHLDGHRHRARARVQWRGGNPLTIVSKNSKCAKTANSPVPGCVKGSTYFDSFGGFASPTTTASLAKAVKHLTFVVNAVTYAAKGTGSTEVLPGGLCGATEVGFSISGVVKAPKQDKVQTVAVVACLGHVTGSNLADPNNFVTDLSSNNPAEVITSVTVDPATSTLHIG